MVRGFGFKAARRLSAGARELVAANHKHPGLNHF